MKKLSTKNKIAIIRSEKSSRTLAKKYNCHHSSIANIRQETNEILEEYWNRKSEDIGRPKNNIIGNEYLVENKKLKAELEGLKIGMQLQKDYLNLRLKMEKEKDNLKKK